MTTWGWPRGPPAPPDYPVDKSPSESRFVLSVRLQGDVPLIQVPGPWAQTQVTLGDPAVQDPAAPWLLSLGHLLPPLQVQLEGASSRNLSTLHCQERTLRCCH